MLGFVYCEMPGIAVDQLTASTGRVRFDPTWAKQNPNSFTTQRFHAAHERRSAGECGVDEWEDDDRHGQAGCFGKDTEGVGVADA